MMAVSFFQHRQNGELFVPGQSGLVLRVRQPGKTAPKTKRPFRAARRDLWAQFGHHSKEIHIPTHLSFLSLPKYPLLYHRPRRPCGLPAVYARAQILRGLSFACPEFEGSSISVGVPVISELLQLFHITRELLCPNLDRILLSLRLFCRRFPICYNRVWTLSQELVYDGGMSSVCLDEH